MRWLVLALVAACNPPQVDGQLTVTTDQAWVFAPSACSNGDTREFYGADLTDGAATVRVFQDPIVGWLVTITKQGDPSTPDLRLAPATCTRFDATLSVDPCGRCTKNDHDEDDSTITGHVDLDCPVNAGRATGALAFANCDNPEEDN